MSSSSTKTERLKAIENGKGIQHILDEAYKILGNPILTHDMEYKLLAHNDSVNDDPIWNEFIENGSVGYERLIFYRDECFFETVADVKKVTFLISDKLPYKRLFGKLFTKDNIQVGCACIPETDKPFEDDDPALFEIVCDILNMELCESEFFQIYGQEYMETLVGSLIEGNIKDKDLYTAHIESIYVGLSGVLRLAVVDIGRRGTGQTDLAYYRDLLKRSHPHFKYAIYSGYIVIIMSSDNATLNIEDLSYYYMHLEQNNMYAGVSGCFENIFELPKYYNEAVNA